MKNIAILVLDGVLDSSLAITLDCLRTAQTLAINTGSAARVRYQTIGAAPQALTGCGLRLSVDATFETARAPDWVVVPGLGIASERELDARLAQADARQAMRWLGGLAGGPASIAASCSAVFLLAQAGLLDGRRATTTWWLAPAFRARYPKVLLDDAKMLVSDGPRLSAGAALAQLDLMLALLTDTMGAAVAAMCARYLLIDQRPSQARYMIPEHLRQQDPAVAAAERWIDAHLAGPVSVRALAAALAMAPKTLARHVEAASGASTIKLIQRRRLLQAAHLLETTALSVEAVALRVGYGDSTALRKLIKREFGVTPGALRGMAV